MNNFINISDISKADLRKIIDNARSRKEERLNEADKRIFEEVHRITYCQYRGRDICKKKE